MLNRIISTSEQPVALILRLALGLVMLPHGLQKAFGLFGGFGFDGTIGHFASMGIPVPVGIAVILIETLGSVALIVGALSRLAALGMIAVMAGAVATTHTGNGFFMNWSGTQSGEGPE